jgi:hypothetical protein
MAGSGVRSLMHGPKPEPEPVRPPESSIPSWYLLGGDLLLAGLAIIILYTSPHPLSWKKELVCAALLILGGFLAAIAVLQEPAGSCAGAGVMPE